MIDRPGMGKVKNWRKEEWRKKEHVCHVSFLFLCNCISLHYFSTYVYCLILTNTRSQNRTSCV
jgi:hypothetical protein